MNTEYIYINIWIDMQYIVHTQRRQLTQVEGIVGERHVHRVGYLELQTRAQSPLLSELFSALYLIWRQGNAW
jgi:hypothetical protein